MRDIKSLLVFFLVVSITLSSCSNEDEPKETLTVTEVVGGVTIDKTFEIDARDVFTDTEGFEFYLSWTPTSIDLDFKSDMYTEKENFLTGLNRYESASYGSSESLIIKNYEADTFGKTLIYVFDSYEGDINYNLEIRRLSDDTIVKGMSGTIQSTSDKVSFAGYDNYGFINLGTFVKDGNKFGFDY